MVMIIVCACPFSKVFVLKFGINLPNSIASLPRGFRLCQGR
jgi:hypothetical protein